MNRKNRVNTYQEYLNFVDTQNGTVPDLNDHLNEPNTQTALDNWISGMINGEGSFAVTPDNVFIFCIEHTDKEFLDLLKKDLTSDLTSYRGQLEEQAEKRVLLYL